MATTKHRPANGGVVSREEFSALTKLVDSCAETLDVQFKRIAQMQAELDRVQLAWARRTGRPKVR